jgi:hypothetical protein
MIARARAILFGVLLLELASSPSLVAQEPAGLGDSEGRFIGTPTIAGNSRAEFKLVEDFAYIDPQGKRWDAPRGSKTDCASIPRVLWSLVGGPCEGNYLRASIIHDVYCERGLNGLPNQEPWQSVHRMFYHAMRAGGVSKPYALLLYAAVYKYGPTWAPPPSFWRRLWTRIWRFGGVPPPPPPPYQPTEQDMQELRQRIESQKPQTPEEAERAVR